MIPALLAALLFAVSVICASRTARLLGPVTANFARLLLAVLVLGAWAHVWGSGLVGPGLPWFLLSGLIGFGIGDLGLFLALPRMGSRVTLTIMQCVSPACAAAMEWLWLGYGPGFKELLSGALILLGVAMALLPTRGSAKVSRAGLFWAAVGTFGQAGGAVISRKAVAVSEAAGLSIDGGTAAYQRVLAGVIFAAIMFLLFRSKEHRQRLARAATTATCQWGWVTANTLAGPVLGVACYQWALALQPTAIVLPIVALSSLIVIPLAWHMEGESPHARTLVGAVLAVAGVMLLARALYA